MKEINHECYISLEVAKLLKEAEFDWESDRCYVIDTLVKQDYPLKVSSVKLLGKKYLYAPTLDVAQRWLREVKNISVNISSTCYSEWEFIIRKINQSNYKDNTILALTACGFYTYEEALEIGIKKTLEIILEKGE